MYVDERAGMAYVAIPRTASTSIHNYYGYNIGYPEPNEHYMRACDLERRLDSFFKFAFVRNPWEKTVSTYFNFTRERKNQYSRTVTTDKPLLSEFEDFTDFCCRLKDSEWCEDVFFRSQRDFVIDRHGEEIPWIEDYANLNMAFGHLCEFFDLPQKELQHLSVGKYDHGYRKYYTADARKAIAALYREDIERFDYVF
jgi:hypothetical protein